MIEFLYRYKEVRGEDEEKLTEDETSGSADGKAHVAVIGERTMEVSGALGERNSKRAGRGLDPSTSKH